MLSVVKKLIKKHSWVFKSLKLVLLYVRFIKGIFKRDRYATCPHKEYRAFEEIKENGYHCFFGYYDKSPISPDNTNVLFLRVKDNDIDSMAEVCVRSLMTKETRVIGKTNAWNWQQASMMQWIDNDIVVYNRVSNDQSDYCSVQVNINNMEENIYPRASYSYKRNFSKYLSLNFYRLDLYAKGYGYSYNFDSLENDKDGIWEIDCESKQSKLILSLKTIMNFESKDYWGCQHYVNHVAYCPNEQFIIFIHRWQVAGGEFSSRLLKYDTINGKMVPLLDNGHVSHYCWKSPSELFIYATDSFNRKGYMIVNIDTLKVEMANGLPEEDGHPTYSSDGTFVLTDSYPDNVRKQYLFIYDTKNEKLYKLDSLWNPFRYFNENRCDLHPRLSFDQKSVICDSTHSGLRSLRIYHL